jgi:predicted transcriptional regulator
MISKGRHRTTPLPGERNPSAKLNARQVDEIRSSGGVPLTKLAAFYGVSRTAIWNIMSGKSWTTK